LSVLSALVTGNNTGLNHIERCAVPTSVTAVTSLYGLIVEDCF
jgi:hypothetical protein